MPFYNEGAMAQESFSIRGRALPAGAVRISSNENPLGPCPEALEAITSVAKFGGRYSPHGEQGEFINAVAEAEGLKPEYVTHSPDRAIRCIARYRLYVADAELT